MCSVKSRQTVVRCAVDALDVDEFEPHIKSVNPGQPVRLRSREVVGRHDGFTLGITKIPFELAKTYALARPTNGGIPFVHP